MTFSKQSEDAIQFEALLIARTYIYEMFHHLCGGVTNAELLASITSDVVLDILEEYESVEEMAALRELLGAYAAMTDVERADFTDRAKDEYTRVFIGPGALPASPYESPYRGSHDMALLQENTLSVREAYRAHGMEPKRLHAIPDDHIAFICSFMAKRAQRACGLYEDGKRAALVMELRSEGEFIAAHMLGWVDIFAQSVATSQAASMNVIIPRVLAALAAFVAADRAFTLEGMAWLVQESDDTPEKQDGYGARSEEEQQIAAAFAEAKAACAALREVSQVGLEDYSFAEV